MKIKLPARKPNVNSLVAQALDDLNAAESVTRTFAEDSDKLAGYQICVSNAIWHLEQLMEVLG